MGSAKRLEIPNSLQADVFRGVVGLGRDSSPGPTTLGPLIDRRRSVNGEHVADVGRRVGAVRQQLMRFHVQPWQIESQVEEERSDRATVLRNR